MRLAYRPLFQVRVRHAYYKNGAVQDDFAAAPVTDLGGLVFKPTTDGFDVYAQTAPDTEPAQLLRPLATEGRPMRFLLHARNPHLVNISELPAYRPAGQVFYFNNLRLDQTDGRLHLGDSVADALVGDAIDLIAEAFAYPFDPAVESATLTTKDIFGNTLDTRLVLTPQPGTPIAEYRFELNSVSGIGPGRYTLSDDHGGSQQIYFDPVLFRQRPFAVIEIFDSTTLRRPDQSELVPEAYRFLDGDGLTGLAPYHIQIAGRETTWRYNVAKTYTSGTVTLASLSIDGDVAFSKEVSGDLAVFTSDTRVPLSETVRALSLMNDTALVRALPNPGLRTPLQAGTSAASYVSELFINV